MKMKCYLLIALALTSLTALADNDGESREKKFEVHGTVRGKYEYQPEIKQGRFQVRNARVSIEGTVIKSVGYKAEIDLSDQGQMRMLDAFVRVRPVSDLDFSIGQMRVPFSIDAHRSPHLQYFANRSFIAKQVGDVRDVGAMLSYAWQPAGLTASAGLFNGAGITEQKEWHRHLNYAAKVEWKAGEHFDLALSSQTICPDSTRIWLYDVGLYYEDQRWHAEAEYLFKTYAHNAFSKVHAFNTFVTYTLPLKRVFQSMQFLARYDYMTDHSDGTAYEAQASGRRRLALTDYQRGRLTGGITLCPGKPRNTAIRLNYEKYFYRHGAVPKPSERDKAVVEFMVHF